MSGNARDATTTDVSYVSGRFQGGQAVNFVSESGVSPAYVEIPSSAWLGDNTHWTAMAWVKCSVCKRLYMENNANNHQRNELNLGITGPFGNWPNSGDTTT